MSVTLERTGASRTMKSGRNEKNGRRITWLIIFAVLLGVSILASLTIGLKSLSPDSIVETLAGQSTPESHAIIFEQRIPRTLIGIACGAALAVAGSLMQSLTRNPLAEPGLMGVNAGAAVAVILTVVLFGVLGIWQYMIAAAVGGAIAATVVYTLGRGRDGSIVKLALAGVAISAALVAVAQGLMLSNQDAFDEFRVWVTGSLEGRDISVAQAVAPVILVGLLFVAPSINALSMGEEAAISLGVRVYQTQNLTLLAVTLLAGAATAAIGPISFVGLAVPFVVRAIMGNDVRWVNYGSALLGPVWLLMSDVLARVIMATPEHPQETQVGIIATLAGAPLFLFLMTRRKVEAL
mgnify:CR=1 FL=1